MHRNREEIHAFKMPVVERKADAVQTKALEESGICVLEKVFEELTNAIIR